MSIEFTGGVVCANFSESCGETSEVKSMNLLLKMKQENTSHGCFA